VPHAKSLIVAPLGLKATFGSLLQHASMMFPPGIHGIMYADKVHFNHPMFDSHHEAIDPKNHGKFTMDLHRKMWKDIQSDYDTIITKFTKSGHHNSNFMQAAMVALEGKANTSDLLEVSSSIDEEDLNDFCCFTNSSFTFICG